MRYFVFTCLAIFLVPGCASARIVITEVMYDVPGTDTGREWIEVHNDAQEAADLSLRKLFEANTGHKLTALGISTVPAGGFAIISDVPDKFLTDHVGFQGLVFDSTFSLSNDGETIAIRDSSSNDEDSLSYQPSQGGGGDGFSLQRMADGTWITATPTPGSGTVATQSEVPMNDNTSTTSNESSSTVDDGPITYASYSSQSVANTSPDLSEIIVTSGRSRLGFVGLPLNFRARIKKETTSTLGISHSWSMGDGASKYGEHISYAYRFPGDYTVVLNSHTKETDAVSRTKVKILDPKVSISEANPDFIELLNSSDYELNIGGMILRTSHERTVLSEDIIIGPHSSVRLPSSSTKLGHLREFVALDSPLGNNFVTISVSDTPILLPEGMDPEAVRIRFINALKTYGK